MGSFEASDFNGVLGDGAIYCYGRTGQVGACNVQESYVNVEDEIVDNFDSYFEDINNRLTVSRMVSDSVIKGMVSAISQEAAEVVASKEVEVAGFKEAFCSQWIGESAFDAKHAERRVGKNGREILRLLNHVAKEQLERLGKCILNPKEFTPVSDMTGLDGTLGGYLGTKNDIDKAFYSLKSTIEALCQQVDAMAFSPIDSMEEPELEIRGELEGMILSTIVQGVREEHERRLWDVNNVLNFIDRCKEISSLRHELELIHKSLVGPEVVHLSPQESLDGDNVHHKVLSNHGLHSCFPSDGNGGCEESKINIPENLETSKLNHMSRQELYKHFRIEITKMKRDHESTVHQMTDQYFSLKRELMREREHHKDRVPFAVLRKDKETESLWKKMPLVISKLDDILKESGKLSEFCDHSKDKLDSLLSENCRLREKLEACYMSLQASDATEKLSQHSLAEENLQKLVGDLKGSLEDARLEASASEEVYRCKLKEVADQMKSDHEDLDLKSVILQEIVGLVYEEAFHAASVATTSDYGEILDLQSTLMLQINTVVFQEVLTDMSMELSDLKDKCHEEGESMVFLEAKFSETEKELSIVVEENKKLKHQALVLDNIIEDKDKALHDVTEERNRLMDLKTQHEASISDRNEELLSLKEKLEGCQKRIDFYTIEVKKMTEALELSEENLREANEELSRFVAALEQEQNHLALVRAKDKEHEKQMKCLCLVIEGLSKSFADFELKANETIGWHTSRLENSAIQLHSLLPKVNVIRRTGLLYKERLEKRGSDLQKAESEVDLLGDEVDALLSLLEKIYVALDHYSPILQHYPGIIEILKLVGRELSGEALKPVSLLLKRC